MPLDRSSSGNPVLTFDTGYSEFFNAYISARDQIINQLSKDEQNDEDED
jgi:hypothetical protein